MYSILLDVWHHVESLKPAFISKTPHFNFITVHYFWIIGMALFGSICLYIRGEIKYIDALFLASGASTQSGLNTININQLNTWQQVVVFLIPMATNPITINSFVVFLRLYWFEKRFQHIAREASRNRRSMAKSLSKARTGERDLDVEERGVDGRKIVVMHESTRANGMTDERAVEGSVEDQIRAEKERMLEQEKTRSSNESSSEGTGKKGLNGGSEEEKEDGQRPQIKFADQVKPSHARAPSGDERLPAPRRTEEHIAILERQRHADDGAVLRIPGPRDADAGIAPQAVDDADTVHQTISRRASTFDSRQSQDTARNQDDQQERPRRNITIAEPQRSPIPVTEHVAEDATAAKNTLSALRFRKPRIFKSKHEKLHEDHHDSSRTRTNTLQTIRSALSRDKEETMPYLSWEATVGRNSMFVDLTEEQREELGGIEYRSLKSLALILTCYFWGFSVFGMVCLTPWIYTTKTYGVIVEGDGQGRGWWGIFTANSAFTDLGYTLTPDSMISFGTAIWPLLLMSFLIIIGNTGFPIMLRIIIWVTSKYVPRESGIWEELKFLLDHPRRCFTLLFPAKATWWLFWILVILNGLDLIFFIILDLGNSIVTQLPVNIRVLDGWFQAVSTRTAGFGVVNLAELHPAIQVSYLIMMYISVLPIAISVRRTNVYEEKSLGIYGNQAEENEDEGEPSYVGAHLRRQLSFDLWYIFLGFFVIAISEGTRLQSGDPAFTMFSVLFEVVSAYGTVGLSLGYTNIDASFSAEFGVIAKLVIIAMQVRGRHRGLPYELDRAILLPSEHLQRKEAETAAAHVRRRSSIGTMATAAQVNSGATKTNKSERSRSRGRSPQRQAQNFLSTLLHPGPTIPNSHRNIHKGDLAFERTRRHSIAVASTVRNARSLSPRAYGTSLMLGRDGGDGATERRVEGRRQFYQDGLNPPPKERTDTVTSRDVGPMGEIVE
ncbi:potassium transport protein TRK1/TRK2 [Mollisia scopiformis]|uniref:Potassium transport protein n=1 Tax=Mollisia scopiformis TaxID=149040 RepID=A0A194XCL6_MOLSC|nr:potassium transport protein TRK1/TRK2 [Mollisia scopiformis]KUJ17492.1 potassium transport protein TRK1/TRK2 [Mollisia scopiformis]